MRKSKSTSAKNPRETGKRMNKTKGDRISIFLIAIAIVAIATLLAALAYFIGNYAYEDFFNGLAEMLEKGDIASVFLIVWLMVIPLLFIALIVLNVVRRRKTKKMKGIQQEAMQLAADREAEKRLKEQRAMQTSSRFHALNALDAKTKQQKQSYRTPESLEELCNQFRSFAAGKLNLYYDLFQIREFIAGLATSRVIILQGMSGTGKTSLAYAFGEFLGNPSLIVPVQPMWKERTDLLGYYNEFTKQYNETPLLRKMYEANASDKMYLTVLDEMNIARVEYYFAEFLSMLEIPDPEGRYLEIVPDAWPNDPAALKDGRIKLPENMWFLGTANNDDSTFAISDKVYDRAIVLTLDRKASEFELSQAEKAQGRVAISTKQFFSLVSYALGEYELTNRNERRLKALDAYLQEKFEISFGNRIMKQIRRFTAVFVGCGGEELEALDGILCQKVLRKIEAKNAAYVRAEADALCRFIAETFGEDKMQRSLDCIRRMTVRG